MQNRDCKVIGEFSMGYYLNHVEMMKKFIEERLEKGIKTFTHKNILKITNANCPYSVLKSLKKYYEIEYEDKTNSVKKEDLKGGIKYIDIRYREYTILKRKDEHVKKPSIRRESETYQLPLIFVGESFN